MAGLRDASDPAGALATDAVKALGALLAERDGWAHALESGRHVIRDELGILIASNGDLAAAVETAQRWHKVTPVPGTAARTKPGFGTASADLANALHYPVEVICAECGGMARSEGIMRGWNHTGRRPGDPR